MTFLDKHCAAIRATKLFGIAVIYLMLLSGCELNRLKAAEELYNEKRYIIALQQLDDIVTKTGNGAVKTQAELLRSYCYYDLGLLAFQRDNLNLAISIFKIANSPEADEQLAEIYKKKADKYLAEEQYESALENYANLLIEIPANKHVPEVRYRRIRIFYEAQGNQNAAWMDYKNLYDLYPNNSYELLSRRVVKGYADRQLEYARLLTEQKFYDQSLNVLFEQERYPVAEPYQVSYEISRNYRAQAEHKVLEENYIEADRFFRIAMQYHPDIQAEIELRLKDLAALFIQKGDVFLNQMDFENALINYRKSFDIIPDYPAALQAIERVNTIKQNIQQAALLFAEGEKAEVIRNYREALRLYREANTLHSEAEYRTKITQMQNLIEAERDPVAFTQRIINEYRGGILNSRINAQINELQKKYKRAQIRDAGWKILLAGGQFRYEARFDIFTPQENYFYIWQVNLKDRSISALNKISEDMMK